MESKTADRPHARAIRPLTVASWLSSGLIVAWGLVAVGAPELAEFLFGEVLWPFLGLGLPLVALGLNWLAFFGLRRAKGWGPGAALARALFSLVAFAWLAYMGVWVVLAIVVLPPLGLGLLVPWGAEVAAEILFILAAVRSHRRQSPTPAGGGA